MERQKLCLGTNRQFSAAIEQQIPMIREAGFDAVFFDWEKDAPIGLWCRLARENGLAVQSLHAPYGGCRALWETDNAAADAAYAEILDSLLQCEKNGIPILVSHAFIGFDVPPIPKETGLRRYGDLIKEAERRGIVIAFENTEGEEYLDAILKTYGGSPAVGFCWDSGHEMCYNRGRDLLGKYGDLLVCTHINDNLGIQDKDGRITWLDDLHLLPFDGVADWEENARRLVKTGYAGTLTFELNTKSKPSRHENDRYAAMPLDGYLSEAFGRACRVQKFVNKQLQS